MEEEGKQRKNRACYTGLVGIIHDSIIACSILYVRDIRRSVRIVYIQNRDGTSTCEKLSTDEFPSNAAYDSSLYKSMKNMTKLY